MLSRRTSSGTQTAARSATRAIRVCTNRTRAGKRVVSMRTSRMAAPRRACSKARALSTSRLAPETSLSRRVVGRAGLRIRGSKWVHGLGRTQPHTFLRSRHHRSPHAVLAHCHPCRQPLKPSSRYAMTRTLSRLRWPRPRIRHSRLLRANGQSPILCQHHPRLV
jgi:hypothetical protein